jgi:hypothetical protein
LDGFVISLYPGQKIHLSQHYPDENVEIFIAIKIDEHGLISFMPDI